MSILKDIEDKIVYCDDEYDAVNGADAAVIVTEWNRFRWDSNTTAKTIISMIGG